MSYDMGIQCMFGEIRYSAVGTVGTLNDDTSTIKFSSQILNLPATLNISFTRDNSTNLTYVNLFGKQIFKFSF